MAASSLILTKHDGTVVEFPTAELAQTLAHLVAGGNTRCQGQSGVTLLSVSGTGLLLVDSSWHIGRRLVETFTVVSEASFPFGIAFQQSSTMFTLSQALNASGFVGSNVVENNLADVYMAQYFTTSDGGGPLSYVDASSSNLVLDEGSFQTRPAKIRRLSVDSTYITSSTEGEEEDIVLAAGPSLLEMATTVVAHTAEIETLEADLNTTATALSDEIDATDTALAALTVEVGTKAPQSALNSTDAALAALTVEVGTKAPQSALNSTDAALAALTVEVDGKQDSLSAGTSLAAHEKLLENTTIKSLAAGANVTLVSTGDVVSISAEGGGATSAEGTVGLPLVNDAGEILRLRAGAGAYTMSQTALGAVELGVVTQGAQFQAPFFVMDQTNGTTLRSRLGDTKAEFFTPVEVSSLKVGGTDFDVALSNKQDVLQQAGVGEDILYDGNRVKRIDIGTGLSGGTIVQPNGSQNLRMSVVPDLTVDSLTATSSLTVAGTDFATALSGKEPKFEVRAPIQKGVNLLSGDYELRIDPNGAIDVNEVATDNIRASTAPALTVADNLVVTGNLSVDGTIGGSLNPYWVCIKCNQNGAILTSRGRHSPSVTKLSGDVAYDITWPAHPDGTNYVFSVASTEFHDLVRNLTPTSFRFYMRNVSNSGTPLNGTGEFSIVIFA